MEIHGPPDRPGRPGADRRAGVRPVPDRPGAARPAAGAASARDRRPPHRGLARRHHRPNARRARSIAAVLHGRLGKEPARRGARRGPGRTAPPGTPRTRPSRPPGCSTPGRPSSAASSPCCPRVGAAVRGGSSPPRPGRCGRTGSAGPPSWSPTGKRPGSPTRRRRSARCRRPGAAARGLSRRRGGPGTARRSGPAAGHGPGRARGAGQHLRAGRGPGPGDVSAELAAADRRCKADIVQAQAAREAGGDAEADTAGILAEEAAGELAAASRRRGTAGVGRGARRRGRASPGRRSRAPAPRPGRACRPGRRLARNRAARREEFRARLLQIVAEAEPRYAAEVGKAEPEAMHEPAVWEQPESQTQAEATPQPSCGAR